MSSITVPAPGVSAPQQFDTSPQSAFPRAKLNAFTRFKNYVNSFRFKETRPKVDFPPPSWFTTDESTVRSDEGTRQGGTTDAAEGVNAEAETPEPVTFAMKIRQLLDLLPLPTNTSVSAGVRQSAGAPEPDAGTSSMAHVYEKGPPIPDIVDARMKQLLTSEEVMNGIDSRDNGPRRQSVWSALEGLSHGTVSTEEDGEGPSQAADTEREEGVMMYAPLEPTEDSQVEVADSELENIEEEPPTGEPPGRGKRKAADGDVTPPTAPTTLETHWVPSTTKISVFTTWWGYRLYLPPPVMKVLNSNQMKATQRATLITTTLQWFVTKVPMVIIPPQLKPAVTFLRRLSPILGYVGVFIAWSWGRISACDTGNGVVLTATWLLPVALIPMPWDAGDIQGPPNPPPGTLAAEEEAGPSTFPSHGDFRTRTKNYFRQLFSS
ncbi:hypothetical protein LshimejAT787_1400180 [Lyophyllum shimeji]|uniref:Uncharacterized protein n=1 Tax=Lyophyllum shimeji TaxID=47721 RepID=A0A9P3PXQ4_LYOSH|nr:hypothetical protein LshimejAT787_1400180 [Lyophyllum shimeji]